tara:strand:- start:35 stop:1018 length:984 start_codon:yes stop_codon:yes gene_type:complete
LNIKSLTIPSILSAFNILVAFIAQLLILYSITSPSELDLFLKQLTVPFFAIGIVFATFREDFYSQFVSKINNKKQLIIPFDMIKKIFFISGIVFILMILQGNFINVSIFGSLLFLFSSFTQIASSLYKYFYNAVFPALLPSIVSLSVITLTLILNLYLDSSVNLVLIYLIPNILIILIFYFIFKKFIHFNEAKNQINFKTILHNIFFSISIVIEGFLLNYFSETDFTHLAFLHRIVGSLNAFVVTYIFFNLDSLINQNFNVKRFIQLIFLVQIFYVFLFLSIKLFDFPNDFLDIFKLDINKLFYISYFIFPAGVLNAGVYFLIRKAN